MYMRDLLLAARCMMATSWPHTLSLAPHPHTDHRLHYVPNNKRSGPGTSQYHPGHFYMVPGPEPSEHGTSYLHRYSLSFYNTS